MSSQKPNKALTMADLMKTANTKFVSPKKGETLEATVTKLTPSEILVDIGTKSQALVLEKDKKILRSLLSTLKVGDKVSVYILNPESDLGYTVVSLRKFNDEKVWEQLGRLQKSKEQLDVTIDGITKGGFLVSTRNGISGFLPNSQADFNQSQENLLNKTIKATVIELNKPLKKVIFSQKTAMDPKEFDEIVKNVKKGQALEVEVTNVAPFGIFSIFKNENDKKVEGFIHISEIAWEKTDKIGPEYNQGSIVKAEVLGLDREGKRVNLSIKRLTKNPYEEKLKEFTQDKKVKGTVSEILANGVSIDLGEGIEGFIKKEKIPPTLKYTQGSVVELTVIEVDRKQKVILAPVLKEKPIGYR